MAGELLVLGSASALTTARRYPTGLALKVGGRLTLLDCGAPAAGLLPRMGEDPLDVAAICITHFHPDHVAELPIFVEQAQLLPRAEPLDVLVPPGGGERIRHLLTTMLMVQEHWPFPLHLTDVELGRAYPAGHCTVTFHRTTHLDAPRYANLLASHPDLFLLACLLVVDAAGTRVVFSGDVGSANDVVPFLEGCNVLVHETAHVSLPDLCAVAVAHRVPHLVLTHIHPDLDADPGRIDAAFGGRYTGLLTVAHDGMRIPL